MSSLRSRLFKNANKDADELRRRRQDESLELRKLKKEEQLQKRRNINLKDDLDESNSLTENNKENAEVVDFDAIVANMTSKDTKMRFDSIQKCRKILSRAKNPPIDEFFSRNAVKILIDNLTGTDENIIFEAAWALTNIASGDSTHTFAVARLGGVQKFIQLVDCKNDAIAEQCIWALGNIAGDCANLRDIVIKDGVLEPTIRFLERVCAKPAVVSNIAWMLSNLCRNKNPSPPREVVVRLLPVLNELLRYPSSSNVIVDTAWALAYASDSANNFIDDILASGCVPTLVALLSSNQPTIISPALRAIGNIVIGDDKQTQQVLDYGLLSHVPSLLNSPKSVILKETCWMLSNITAGTPEQISQVIEFNVIPCVLNILQNAEFKVQKEACWVISNTISGGNKDHIEYLLSQDVVRNMAHMLSVSEPKIVQMVVEAYSRLFEYADENGQLEKICVDFENCGALDAMEALQDHKSEEIYSIVYKFICRYFNDDAEEDADTQEAHQQPAQNAPVLPDQNQQEFTFNSNDLGQQSNFDF